MKYSIQIHVSTYSYRAVTDYRIVNDLKKYIEEIGGNVDLGDSTSPVFFYNIPENEVDFIKEYLTMEEIHFTVQKVKKMTQPKYIQNMEALMTKDKKALLKFLKDIHTGKVGWVELEEMGFSHNPILLKGELKCTLMHFEKLNLKGFMR